MVQLTNQKKSGKGTRENSFSTIQHAAAVMGPADECLSVWLPSGKDPGDRVGIKRRQWAFLLKKQDKYHH